jgi:hypothetical protein
VRKRFLRQAQASEFRLPFSVRLQKPDGLGGWETPDDQLEISWDDAAVDWPLGPIGGPAAAQTVSLSGGFTMESIFSGDTTGYGELGATETILGTSIKLSADPFVISEFASACPDGPQLETNPGARVQISSAGSRYGVLNLFSGAVRGTLSLRLTFSSLRADDCGGLTGITDTVDNTSALPIPVRFTGKFRINPAITRDGKLRFGSLTIDDAAMPQASTFGLVRSCTLQPTGVSPCSPQQFPARFKLKKVTADVLLGDVQPYALP